MPSRGHIQFTDRRGIVYTICPFGIIRSKRPKVSAPNSSSSSFLAMVGSWSGEDGPEEVSYNRMNVEHVNADGGWGHGGHDSRPCRAKKEAQANARQAENSKAAAQHNCAGSSQPPPPPRRRRRPEARVSPGRGEMHEPLPFCTAARKLQMTLTRSIDFFKRFYREFQKETRALGAYADLELINRAWQRKIRNTERYLTPRTSKGAKDNANTGDTGGNNNSQDPGKPSSSGREDSTFIAATPDLRTFSELQREVVERVTALYQAELPESRLRAPTDKYTLSSFPTGGNPFDSCSDNEDCSGPEDRHILEQWKLALTLKRHVQDSYGELIRAVRAMNTDYMAVTAAARELEMLKRDLEIYRRGWDETFRDDNDDDDNNNNNEDGDEGGRDTEETMAGGGFQ